MSKLSAYYKLTKPGIIRGNAVHVLAGSLLASSLMFEWSTTIGVIIGTSLIIASACVANNYLDRDIDAKMKRTSKRASVTGEVSFLSALVFLLVLLAAGVTVLLLFTNLKVIFIGLIAYILYVFAYGYAKRVTVHSTLIGAIPGALPAMAGYVAVDGEVTIGAWLIFLIVLAWQMPHFYAISIFRASEYRAAKIPVLGAIRPIKTVKRYILAYMIIYLLAVCLMISSEVMGPVGGLLMLIGTAYWFYVYATAGSDEIKWAKSIFGSSLLLTILLLIACGLNIFVGPSPALQ